MRAKTFDEVLEVNRQARRAIVTKQAGLPDLSHVDFDAIANAIIREAAREAGPQKAGPGSTAVTDGLKGFGARC